MIYHTTFKTFKLSGADTDTFLQGQLSNDIRKNGINAFCSPKGEVLAIFVLIRDADFVYLLSQDENIDSTIKRLNMFILRSDVKIEKSHFHAVITDSAPETSLHLQLSENCFISLQENPPENASNATPILMQNGFVRLSNLSSGKYVAQLLNLDILNALNWQKGCYVGQEVIARLHYRGKVTKRCFLIKTEENLIGGENIELQNAQGKPVRGIVLQAHDNMSIALFSNKGLEQPLKLNNLTVHLTSFHED